MYTVLCNGYGAGSNPDLNLRIVDVLLTECAENKELAVNIITLILHLKKPGFDI
jgi:hypothetical protein